MAAVLWAMVAVPLATGLALIGVGRRADRIAGPAAVAAAAGTVGTSIAVATARPRAQMPLLAGIPARLAVDGLSAVMVLVVSAVTLAVLLYALGEFGAGEARARFFGLMLLFAGAMLVTVTAADLVALLAGWELIGAASYALIGYWWADPDRVRSANLAFLTTRTADVGLYLAAGAALAGGAGDLSLARLPDAAGPWVHVVTAGVVVAALGKSAQLPFSFWLSRAMAGPSPVSALLHSATMVAAGAYLLLRVEPLLRASSWAADTVAWVGVVTALLLAAVAVAQTDLKQLLAASTCSQIGFMVLAAGSGDVAAGTLQLVAHAATKSLLFLATGAWLVALGTKDLRGLAGAARRYPIVGIAFTVGALTLAGVPPLSIWVAKDEVLSAALSRSVGLYVVGLAAVVLSAGYAAKALAVVWRPQGTSTPYTEQPATGRIAPLMSAPLPALAGAAALLGVLALPPLAGRFGSALGQAAAAGPTPWELAVSGVLAVATTGVVLAARRTALGFPRVLVGWLGLELVAVRGIAQPVMVVARGLAAVDDRVVAGSVQAFAAAAVGAARLTNLRAEATLDSVVRWVAIGARWLGALARRPQTGQLHQYYAQAAIALAVLALVLVLVR
jgi:NADH:ubiquinone oxidoreductase subunit 5 (subunit L)/multisubunit Na+/H+ antiporter MnhA subunit